VNALALVLAVFAPLAIALAVAWPATRRAGISLAPWAAAPALACALPWPGTAAAVLELPSVLLGLRFGLDDTGRGFLLPAALLWLFAGWAARAWHAHDEQRTALWLFWLVTLTGNLWLIAARDAVGFYAGFAMMSFAAYGLVIHARSAAAWYAGRVYLVMAVLGEAALLAGLLLRVAPLDAYALPLAAGPNDTLAAVLLFAGFGVKAGLFGLHLWLPLAHPVAPTPASAVLSGVMIKAGVLGWLRLLPLEAGPWPVLGTVAIALGLAGAFCAVAFGFAQREPKTMLAYSSVSQMGLLALGAGAALLHPPAWPVLAVAITGYALHHGLAKGALFLGVAALPAGSAGRRWALLAQALPALALAGAPWTSGAAAKEALKTALELLPQPWPAVLAWLLPAAALGTTLLMARLMFALARPDTVHAQDPAKRGLVLPWLATVAATLGLGGYALPDATLAGAAAAAAPVLLGLALAALAMLAICRRAPLAAPAPRIEPGDLLTWLAAPIGWLWRALLRLAGAGEPRRRPAATPEARAALLERCERRLRAPPVAGALLLVVLAAAWLGQRG
jgi:formate hydrogenlyase subunit 3/multisubunit Na+/H+ antiporter MnhD subunit